MSSNSNSRSVSVGMVHGRFQPFHVGHVAYFESAISKLSRTLIVGITNPAQAARVEATDDHRHLLEANPYTFLDRARMVQLSLPSIAGASALEELLVVPFDVQDQSTWGFIPRSTTQFVNVLEEWDLVKARSFRSYGFPVQEIHDGRITSGSRVRGLIAQGVDVKHLLPSGAFQIVSEHGAT